MSARLPAMNDDAVWLRDFGVCIAGKPRTDDYVFMWDRLQPGRGQYTRPKLIAWNATFPAKAARWLDHLELRP